MVKIREQDFPMEPAWMVQMMHVGPDSPFPGLFPWDQWEWHIMPPWPPELRPIPGHWLMMPSLTPEPGPLGAIRYFDLACEAQAWAFFYEMLGHPWRMISRCQYCYPGKHRYLTI